MIRWLRGNWVGSAPDQDHFWSPPQIKLPLFSSISTEILGTSNRQNQSWTSYITFRTQSLIKQTRFWRVSSGGVWHACVSTKTSPKRGIEFWKKNKGSGVSESIIEKWVCICITGSQVTPIEKENKKNKTAPSLQVSTRTHPLHHFAYLQLAASALAKSHAEKKLPIFIRLETKSTVKAKTKTIQR